MILAVFSHHSLSQGIKYLISEGLKLHMNQIIIQAIGIIGFAIFALSFFIKERKTMLTSQSVGVLILVVHFLLLSAWTGAALTFANAFKLFLFSLNVEKSYIIKTC